MMVPSGPHALTNVDEPDALLLLPQFLAHNYTDSHSARSVCRESYKRSSFGSFRSYPTHNRNVLRALMCGVQSNLIASEFEGSNRIGSPALSCLVRSEWPGWSG